VPILLLALLGCPRPAPPDAAPSVAPTAPAPVSAAPVSVSGGVSATIERGPALAVFNETPFQYAGTSEAMALSPSGQWLAVPHSGAVRVFDARTGEPQRDLTGHGGAVLQLAFATETTLVTADHYGEIRSWDLTGGSSLVYGVEHAHAVSAFAVWQGMTASGDTQGNVLLWKDGQVVVRLGEEEETGDGVTVSEEAASMWIGPHGVLARAGWRGLAHWRLDGTWVGLHEVGPVTDVGFTADGLVVLGTVGYKEYDDGPDIEVRITRLRADGTEEGQQTFPVGDPMAHDLAADGSSLAVWDRDVGLTVIDLASGTRRFTSPTFPLDGHVDMVTLSPTGTHVAVRSERRLNVVDAYTGEAAVDTTWPTSGEMQAAVLGNDGLALMSDRERLWLWEPLGDGSVRSMGIGAEDLDRVGDRVVGFDGSILWSLDLQARELEWEMTGALGYTLANDTATSADGSVVVYGGYDGEIGVVDGATGVLRRTIPTPSEIWEVAVSEDGRRVAASYGSTIGVWGTGAGDPILTLDQEANDLLGWVGDTLAFTGDDHVWTANLRTGEAVSHGEARWHTAAFSADGRWLAWQEDAGATWVLDLPNDRRYAVPEGGAVATAIDPRGEHLLVAYQDRTAAVYRLADLAEAQGTAGTPVVEPPPTEGRGDLPPHVLGTAPAPPERPDWPSSSSADGRVVATLSHRDVIVTVEGAETLNFAPHVGYTDCLAVSPDGKVLATGGTDDLVRLWAVADGASLGAVRALGPVQDIQFADDERLVFVARSEGRSPTMGAARTDGTSLWLRSDLPYRHSDAFAIHGERVATFHMDKVEFLDLSSGTVIARMPSYDEWIQSATWTDEDLVTFDREHTYRWDTSWLP